MTREVVTVKAEPFCAETRLELQDSGITPTRRFYSRNNFPYPTEWPGLTINGAIERPRVVGLDFLASLPRRSLVATLECAGNGRAYLDPQVPGEQWTLGAVSTADWEGVRLSDVLAESGVSPGAVEVLFEAADGFARSLPVDVALGEDCLLVLGMNGEQLPPEHGGPVRVLVPGWYGMSAVKWVSRIAALKEPFLGHFQVERYVIDGRPLREMEVRSVITSPQPGGSLDPASLVRGLAWTGQGSVTGVELSLDGGQTWAGATLVDSPSRFAWVGWRYELEARAGASLELVARARDSAGRVQPLEPRWNALGYGNNAAVRVPVTIRA